MTFDPEAVRSFEYSRWQRVAAAYESTFAGATRPFIDTLLDAARVRHGVRMLDIACGPGLVASRAGMRGATATGLDFSPAMLAVARFHNGAINLDQGDAEALPYADGEFDAVVSNFGIHHVPRPLRALHEALRVLRSGSRVAFSFWAGLSENIAWKLLFDAIARHGDPAASHAPPPGGGFGTAAQCSDALRDVGFVDCTTKLVHATWHHADAQALVASLQAGTARMAAMIEAQCPAAMPAIIADIDECAEPCRDADGIAVPIAAVIASGVKP
ncbi:MAG TPA: methyltransferase domain-containing protein [Acetobacteraceae bacterium]|jgi:SAM-dependent methyltransferase|nr:methyltransferase domain-containing protein [Acetobacteraceae bacterium]